MSNNYYSVIRAQPHRLSADACNRLGHTLKIENVEDIRRRKDEIRGFVLSVANKHSITISIMLITWKSKRTWGPHPDDRWPNRDEKRFGKDSLRFAPPFTTRCKDLNRSLTWPRWAFCDSIKGRKDQTCGRKQRLKSNSTVVGRKLANLSTALLLRHPKRYYNCWKKWFPQRQARQSNMENATRRHGVGEE